MVAVTRRTLLGSLAACATVSAAQDRRPPWPLGVQLWSVADQLKGDFEGTLRRLAAIGYERVEAAGWLDRAPEAFRRSVTAAGLRCDSAHVAMVELAADMRGSAGRARDAGCNYLICSSPLPPKPLAPGRPWLTALTEAMTLDGWRYNADLLNRAAAVTGAAGLKFGYHNHTAEFARYDGQRGYDVLLAETDPKAVLLELDVAWATAGGADAVALMRANRGRVARLHLKDLEARSTRGRIAQSFATVPVGQGVIDWRSIIREAKATGVGGAYVELEPPHARSPFDELTEARDFLKTV